MIRQRPDGGRPRLLVLASTYPRWREDCQPGFVHELSRRMAKRFDVTVVCPSARGALAEEELDGVRVRRFRYAPAALETLVNDGGITTNLRRSRWKYLLVPSFLLSMLWTTMLEVRRFRPAILHAHWVVPQGLIAVLSCLLLQRRIPLVFTSHGADVHAWRGRFFLSIKRFVIAHASGGTVVSRGMVEHVVRLGADRRRIEVVPMGVDLTGRFSPDLAIVRMPYQILFVGRLVEKKGLRHLLDAMPAIRARVPRATLLVAGFGPEEGERRRQAERLGLDDVVSFIGAVPQSSLPGLYRQSAVVAVPFVEASGGDIDGLGLVAVEAAGCGTPVVISRIPATGDVFDETEASFVPPGDVAALADAVAAILESPDSALRADRVKLAATFDWSAVAARYERLLVEAAGLT